MLGNNTLSSTAIQATRAAGTHLFLGRFDDLGNTGAFTLDATGEDLLYTTATTSSRGITTVTAGAGSIVLENGFDDFSTSTGFYSLYPRKWHADHHDAGGLRKQDLRSKLITLASDLVAC